MYQIYFSLCIWLLFYFFGIPASDTNSQKPLVKLRSQRRSLIFNNSTPPISSPNGTPLRELRKHVSTASPPHIKNNTADNNKIKPISATKTRTRSVDNILENNISVKRLNSLEDDVFEKTSGNREATSKWREQEEDFTKSNSSFRGHSIERRKNSNKNIIISRNSIDSEGIQEKKLSTASAKANSSRIDLFSRGVKASGVQTAKSTKTLGKYKITWKYLFFSFSFFIMWWLIDIWFDERISCYICELACLAVISVMIRDKSIYHTRMRWQVTKK